MENLDLFIGRFHPLLVHLPIGFLILAFLMWAFQIWKRTPLYREAIAFALLLGTLSAVAACVAGFLLSGSGEYEGDMLDQHKWAGILTTLVAGVCYALFAFRLQRGVHAKLAGSLLGGMMLGLALTGHLGGNLTHGSDYLTAYAPFQEKKVAVLPPQSMQEALLFPHVIQPILDQKCISCHRSSKLKGGLSLESPESILKGGESGTVFAANIADSELFRRIHLGEEEEEVMPPKGKKQLTEQEIFLLESWISGGVDFARPLVGYGDSVQYVAAAFLGLGSSDQASASEGALSPVDSLVLDELRGKGILVRELLKDSFRYDVHIPSAALTQRGLPDLLKSLEPIQANVLWLNLSGLGLTDDELGSLPELPNLMKLRLEKNALTDKGLTLAEKFPRLEVLNVYGNDLTDDCLDELGRCGSLQKVYVWQTKITQAELGSVRLIKGI
ncbi:ribonuclease inhibitor [Algoriphagus jejuensis]|uniref:Ribonuclease inhibitor n=1 Tax=Algoriphagus jejuensis TaxID=419934 RepID=A0ABN1N5H4_9BACT